MSTSLATTAVTSGSFIGNLMGQNVPQITATNGNATVTTPTQGVDGPSGGTIQLSFNGTLASTSEVQTVTRVGAGNTTFSFTSPANVAATASINLTAATTALQLQTALNGIAALNGNISVTAPAARGPYTVSFINGLANQNVNPLQITVNGSNSSVATPTEGGVPLPADLHSAGWDERSLADRGPGAGGPELDRPDAGPAGLGRQCHGVWRRRRSIHGGIQQRPGGQKRAADHDDRPRQRNTA